ncbi:MarR family transcriptional regulator [Hoyosella sp. YIM 151337]|uniref:MarR family winged helix-turn-helix transcriptional regulator n=1 Tax=Hoyosella sp. YIM 151337 TaxID=2992742 RepID=UPI0022361EF4|nr:MarR family transcriptional regulator [Hoyosella sp. YIM 151337]MCW4352153.1 MarR family transcriptional regulator [Hoyosella sp. YIM 151337]
MTDSSLVYALNRLAKLRARAAEQLLQRDSLTFDQWLALEAVALTRGRDAGLTMAEIQQATQVSGPTLTRVVDKLVLRALLYREVDSVDRRKVRVHLSPRGGELHARVAAELRAAEADWLRDAELDTEMRQAVARLGELLHPGTIR